MAQEDRNTLVELNISLPNPLSGTSVDHIV